MWLQLQDETKYNVNFNKVEIWTNKLIFFRICRGVVHGSCSMALANYFLRKYFFWDWKILPTQYNLCRYCYNSTQFSAELVLLHPGCIAPKHWGQWLDVRCNMDADLGLTSSFEGRQVLGGGWGVDSSSIFIISSNSDWFIRREILKQ